MKAAIKHTICIALVFALTMGILMYVDGVLKIKRTDGVTTIQGLYAQKKDSVDVLLMGSSHAGMNLDAETLWTEYGIASYSPWGSVQPFWNTYYYLLEALKTQKPRVVVVDVYAATQQFEYSDEARQATNTVGMNFSRNKIEAIKASTPKSRWLNLLVGLPIYHRRYAELTQDDFEHFPWSSEPINWKGTGSRYGVGDFSLEDASGVTEIAEIYPKEELYLRKIIELCQVEEIALILVTTPTTPRIAEQPYYNAVAEIARDYDVSYYNFNLMDEEVGFEAKDYWNDGHINTNGARKVTKYLGKIIREKYEVADHRGEEAYESWDINAANVQKEYIRKIIDLDDYFNELARTSKMVFVIKNSSWEMEDSYRLLLNQFEKLGVSGDVIEQSGGGDWILTDTQNGEFINQYFGDMYSRFECGGAEFVADFATGEGICVNGENVYALNGSGIICVVYDAKTRQCIDVVTFLKDDHFVLKHR